MLIKSEGYLPVNTRAYTFSDTKVNVKLTLLTEKHTLLGFKVALPDAGTDGGDSDGGVPPEQLPPGVPPPHPPSTAPPPNPHPRASRLRGLRRVSRVRSSGAA